MPPTERSFDLEAADGIGLKAWLASPPSPRGALLCCHGFTSHGTQMGLFLALQRRALSAGLAVARFDFRAHGASQGTQQDLTFAGMCLDAEAVHGLIARELGETFPVIPLGESFGGGPAVHVASLADNCPALVLWEPMLDYAGNYAVDSTVPYTQMMRAAALTQKMPDWAAFPVLGTSYHISNALLAELDGEKTLEQLRAFQRPVVLYQGSHDRMVGPEPARNVAVENPHVRLRIVPRADHGFRGLHWFLVRGTVRWASAALDARR